MNAAQADFVGNERDYAQLLEQILRIRRGRHYYNPLKSAVVDTATDVRIVQLDAAGRCFVKLLHPAPCRGVATSAVCWWHGHCRLIAGRPARHR